VLRAVAAVGFVAAAGALSSGAASWRVLLVAAVFSLALTVLDWTVAYAGAIIDAGILAALFVLPRV